MRLLQIHELLLILSTIFVILIVISCSFCSTSIANCQSKAVANDKLCEPLSKISKQQLDDLFKLQTRNDFGSFAQYLNFRTGAELGVQKGIFSREILSQWPSVEKFYLIDLWKQQKSYVDLANYNDETQEKIYRRAKINLSPWANRTVFLRMFTSEAAKLIPDGTLDFIYVDARHDNCGVKEDLENYWPKLRIGGIMAGHDYYYAGSGAQNWGICANGSYSPLNVKGAVNEFVASRCLFLHQVEDSWMFFK